MTEQSDDIARSIDRTPEHQRETRAPASLEPIPTTAGQQVAGAWTLAGFVAAAGLVATLLL